MYHNRGVLVLHDRKNALQAYGTETNGKSLPNDIKNEEVRPDKEDGSDEEKDDSVISINKEQSANRSQ